MRTAVLIGITNYQRSADLPTLPGCSDDVDDMRRYLSGIGVSIDPTQVLKDGDATKQRIVTVLTAAINGLGANDELIVHYSGHGAPFPWRHAVHDTICPYDFDWSSDLAILDVDLAELLDQIPNGARVSIVADSCYSGGLEPTFESLRGLAGSPSHVLRTIPIPPDIAAEIAAFRGASDTTFADVADAHDVVALAACGPKRTAADALFSGRPNGAMTYYLLQLLAQTNPPASASELVPALVVALRRFSQVPELHGHQPLFQSPFLLR